MFTNMSLPKYFSMLAVFVLGLFFCDAYSQFLYDFEMTKQGWVPESDSTTRGVISVNRTNLFHFSGKHCLKITLDLTKKVKGKHQGEIRVDLRTHPPKNQFGPLNLLGKTIKAYIRFPSEFEGESNSPNGIQLFVKSVQKDASGKEIWSSLYGLWYNATGHSNDWMEIHLPITNKTLEGMYKDKHFNPQKVCFVGVKFALGGESSPEVNFKGDVFVDCITW